MQRNARRRQAKIEAGEAVAEVEESSDSRLLSPASMAAQKAGELDSEKPASAFDLACKDALPRAPKGLQLKGLKLGGGSGGKGGKGKGKVMGGGKGKVKGNGEGKGGKKGKGGQVVDPNAPKMRQMHWDTVGDNVLNSTNSIFNELQDVDLSSLESELGDLFELKKAEPKEKKASVKEEKKKANILSSDRSKNIEIRISQFKKIGFENLFNIIDTMDQENKLSIEVTSIKVPCS